MPADKPITEAYLASVGLSVSYRGKRGYFTMDYVSDEESDVLIHVRFGGTLGGGVVVNIFGKDDESCRLSNPGQRRFAAAAELMGVKVANGEHSSCG